ncbi:MAG: DUF4173 domain-containing protein [Clostridia bacterium]|nr:DUF4173 domain-containing protein [Clostridia bacterium]
MEKLLATKREIYALIGSFAVLTLLFWVLFSGGLAIGFAVVWLFAVAAAVWYMKGAPGWHNSLSAKLCLLCSVLFTPVYAITHHVGVVSAVFLIQGSMLICWLSLASGHGGAHHRLADLFTAALHSVGALFEGIVELGESLADYKRLRRLEKEEAAPGKRPFPWGFVAGILLALPVLCILIPILTSADAAFDGMMASIGSAISDLLVTILDSAFELVIALILAAIFFYPVAGTLFHLRNKSVAPSSGERVGIASALLLGFYGSICLLCLAYLFSQLSYFFNGFLGILPEEMTAAEYARRGFFELFAFSMVTLVLLSFGICLTRKDRGAVVVKAMLIFLCAFNLLLISTALAKMVLYVNLYGLTPKRLVSSAIMIFLAVLFLILIIGQIFKNFRSLPVVLAAALVIVGTVTYLDPDRIVAEYNVWAWESGKLSTVDAAFLGELSDAAVPALIRVYESEDTAASEAAEKELCRIYFHKCDEYGLQRGDKLPANDNAFAYNLTEHMANDAINEILSILPLGVSQ